MFCIDNNINIYVRFVHAVVSAIGIARDRIYSFGARFAQRYIYEPIGNIGLNVFEVHRQIIDSESSEAFRVV